MTYMRTAWAAMALAATLVVASATASTAVTPIWTHASAWGFNSAGQVGDGSTTSRFSPVAVAGSGNGFVRVSAGGDHSVAIAADGSLWTWGGNANGQLGDGTTVNRSIPAQVPGMTSVSKIAAGNGFTLAVRSDGSVWSWGRNDDGQLGLGTIGGLHPTPTRVLDLPSITDVAAGAVHSLAVGSNGSIWAWGRNDDGELGDGTTTQRSAPVQAHGPGGVVHVAAGSLHSLALTNTGRLYTWGFNNSGQLGDNTLTSRTEPTLVTSIANIQDMAGGENHSLAVRTDGTLFAWGENSLGQLGDGTTTRRLLPGVVPGLTGMTRVAAGFWASQALRSDGTVWSWGLNSQGQLGDGTDVNRLTPVPVTGLTGVTQISMSERAGFRTASHTLVVRPAPVPAFQIALSPDGGTLATGDLLSATVLTSPINGSQQTITLGVAKNGLPPGVTVTFNPPTVVAGGSSTMTFTAAPGTPPSHGESTPITIVGTSTLPSGSASAVFDLLISDSGPSS